MDPYIYIYNTCPYYKLSAYTTWARSPPRQLLKLLLTDGQTIRSCRGVLQTPECVAQDTRLFIITGSLALRQRVLSKKTKATNYSNHTLAPMHHTHTRSKCLHVNWNFLRDGCVGFQILMCSWLVSNPEWIGCRNNCIMWPCHGIQAADQSLGTSQILLNQPEQIEVIHSFSNDITVDPRGGGWGCTPKKFWRGCAAPVFDRIPLVKEILLENIPLAKEHFLIMSPFLHDFMKFQHQNSLLREIFRKQTLI